MLLLPLILTCPVSRKVVVTAKIRLHAGVTFILIKGHHAWLVETQ